MEFIELLELIFGQSGIRVKFISPYLYFEEGQYTLRGFDGSNIALTGTTVEDAQTESNGIFTASGALLATQWKPGGSGDVSQCIVVKPK
jgi:hypothetical protein